MVADWAAQMCFSASRGADGTVGITVVCAAKKKKKKPLVGVRTAVRLHPNHSKPMPVNEPTWPPLHPLHMREDEMDDNETALQNTSYMMDAHFSQRKNRIINPAFNKWTFFHQVECQKWLSSHFTLQKLNVQSSHHSCTSLTIEQTRERTKRF